MRTIGDVRQFMSRKMILSLKSGVANIANKSTLDSVLDDMLFD
jgi:hypothetical protein